MQLFKGRQNWVEEKIKRTWKGKLTSFNYEYVLFGMVALDVLLYFVLIEGVLKQQRIFKMPKTPNATEAFAFFEKCYKDCFPQDKDGFTWKEAIAKANRIVRVEDFEWQKIQKSLRDYEAYRYAGIGSTKIDSYPILRLSVSLREKTYSISKWKQWRKQQ
jgi:hypothetical protein